jgi:hypothetical protein
MFMVVLEKRKRDAGRKSGTTGVQRGSKIRNFLMLAEAIYTATVTGGERDRHGIGASAIRSNKKSRKSHAYAKPLFLRKITRKLLHFGQW